LPHLDEHVVQHVLGPGCQARRTGRHHQVASGGGPRQTPRRVWWRIRR
jgi:hypothetical protein